MYIDKKRHAKESDIAIGDTVLVKQQYKNKFSSRFDKAPYKVIQRKGTMITAENKTRHDYQLSVDGCQLSVDGCQLSVDGYKLSVDGYKLSVDGYQLYVEGYQLSVDCSELSVDGYQLSWMVTNYQWTVENYPMD
eukprot:gene9696-18159_t